MVLGWVTATRASDGPSSSGSSPQTGGFLSASAEHTESKAPFTGPLHIRYSRPGPSPAPEEVRPLARPESLSRLQRGEQRQGGGALPAEVLLAQLGSQHPGTRAQAKAPRSDDLELLDGPSPVVLPSACPRGTAARPTGTCRTLDGCHGWYRCPALCLGCPGQAFSLDACPGCAPPFNTPVPDEDPHAPEDQVLLLCPPPQQVARMPPPGLQSPRLGHPAHLRACGCHSQDSRW